MNKKLIIAMILCTNVSANEIYIEQVGSVSDITITQAGLDNKIGSTITPTFIGGDSGTVTITQTGARNILNSVTNGNNMNITLSYTGDDNEETITCGATTAVTCNNTTITRTILGDLNTIVTNIKATTTSIMTVTGNDNTITHNSTSSGVVSAELTLTGNQNTIDLIQQGTLDKSIKVDSQGSNNNISITQHN